MPANVSPEYKKAEERFREAATPEEKLVCLEEMLSTIPKHKGTEKMQADIKSRISKLRKTLTSSKGPKRADWLHVEKQGAGQVALFGAPNAGKSALVRTLTGLPTEVAAYPFTTTRPAAGMLAFGGIQIQLVDTPPIAPDSPAWVFHILRTADLLVWVIDLADDDLLQRVEDVAGLLAEAHITTEPSERVRHRGTLRVGNKCDDPQSADRLAILQEMLGAVEVIPVSAETGAGLDRLGQAVFDGLGIVRVYTKKPGKPPDLKDPVVLPRGSTVLDAAFHLHKDLAAGLQYARLWNDSGCDGQRVERGHIVQDRDVVEFHA